MADSFVHLHQHTEYSMLDGAARIGDVVNSAVKDGQPAMGITDHGNMYGVLDFYKECRNQGVKPIIGSELYMAHERRDERLQLRGARMDDSGGEAEGGKKPYYHLTTLVENATGYLLTTDSMRAMWEWYLGPDGDPNDAFAAVDTAADLAGLPPALVITAEYDPLRDEGEHYASLLDGFDVDTTMIRYDGMLHGFFGLREIVPQSDEAVTRVAEFLNGRL